LKDPVGARRTCGVEMHGQRDGLLSVRSTIKTAQVMYAERRDPASGRPLYACCRAPSPSRAAGTRGSRERMIKHIPPHRLHVELSGVHGKHDPKLDIGTVTNTDLIRGERRYAPIMDSTIPISRRSRRTAANSSSITAERPRHSARLFAGISRTIDRQTGDARDFYRLYMVPGMLHCSGGDAPTNVNWQVALESWVEKSEAPGDLSRATAREQRKSWGPSTEIGSSKPASERSSAGGITMRPQLEKVPRLDVHPVSPQCSQPENGRQRPGHGKIGTQIDADENGARDVRGTFAVCTAIRRSDRRQIIDEIRNESQPRRPLPLR